MLVRGSRSLSFHLTLAVAAMGVLSALLVALYMLWATSKVDGLAVAREEFVITRAVSDGIDTVVHQQQSISTWDDASSLPRPTIRPGWPKT